MYGIEADFKAKVEAEFNKIDSRSQKLMTLTFPAPEYARFLAALKEHIRRASTLPLSR